MTNEDAIQWCVEHLAVVSFISHYGTPRVQVKPAGYFFQERDTLLAAVEAARNNVRWLNCDNDFHDQCCGRAA